MTPVKNLLFDLGGVLINHDFPAINRRFRELLGADFESVYRESRGLLQQLELGLIDEGGFLDAFRARAGRPLPDAEIIDAWNAVQGELPAVRLRLLEELGRRYRLFLLSNTNAIHMVHLDQYLAARHGLRLPEFARRYFGGHVYFSYQLYRRKPDPAIFTYVLQRTGAAAAETLFIDDNADNIASAAALGLQTLHHDPQREIAEVLPGVLTVDG